MKAAPPRHDWQFKARFRRRAFGWRSQPAITRVKEAVSEIRKVARKDPVLAAEGAVTFLERVSPALEQVDSSSGAIGTAVNHAIDALVGVIAAAPTDVATRDAWLERLFEALQADQIPYIESLGDRWGELCASETLASSWADRLVSITAMALSPDRSLRGYFPGTLACLSALFRARRYTEIAGLVPTDTIWHYRVWVVRALAAAGRGDEAIRYAESCRDKWTNDLAVDAACEEILLAEGRTEEAYARYGLRASRRGTYLATFRAVAAKYPDKPPRELLAALVETTPGDAGKWFATAKEAGLFDEALHLARRSPCDPRTLARAARDFAAERPEFAVEAGLLALHGITAGFGFELTGADVLDAFRPTMAAAERLGRDAAAKAAIRDLIARGGPNALWVRGLLGRMLE